MPVYLVADVQVTDPAQFAKYQAAAGPTLAAHGAKVLFAGVGAGSLEGGWAPQSLAVVEFPDREGAQRWYNSPEFQAAKKLRQGAANVKIAIVQGMPLP